MRVPKRNAGLITKALKLGIFAKGPKFWAEVHRERKNGFFSPEVQSKAGKIGGKVTGTQNAELGRGICAPGVAQRAGLASGARTAAKWKDDPVWAEAQRWQRIRAMHLRWHVRRGIRQASCPLCNPRPAYH
jgi:hypothetical protein